MGYREKAAATAFLSPIKIIAAVESGTQDGVVSVQQLNSLVVRLERQRGHVSAGDDDSAVAASKKRMKHSIHAGAQIVAFLIE